MVALYTEGRNTVMGDNELEALLREIDSDLYESFVARKGVL